MKKTFILLALAAFLILSMSYYISAASDYKNHKVCDITQTVIEGKIYSPSTNKPVGNANIEVVCTHKGSDYTRTTKSVNNGALKGTYNVTFSQSNCIVGDTVVVKFMRNSEVGTASGKVEDDIESHQVNEVCMDIDTAMVNVQDDPPIVPEFGLIAGTITVLSALTVFFVIRRK